MKKSYKIIIGTFVFIFGLLFGGFISFCSAEPYLSTRESYGASAGGTFISTSYCLRGGNANCTSKLSDSEGNLLIANLPTITSNDMICGIESGTVLKNGHTNVCSYYGYSIDFPTCPVQSSTIDVIYNVNSSETITCGVGSYIQILGSSTYSNNIFTPTYNIYYNSGVSTISNTTSDTYLDGTYLYTLSGIDNLFSPVIDCSEPELQFSGYMPTFDITGGIVEPTESGNIFNNFAENSVKFTLSNIPSYIQYVIIIMLLLFIIGFIRKFKRR